jgi:hypothetical protein
MNLRLLELPGVILATDDGECLPRVGGSTREEEAEEEEEVAMAWTMTAM